MASNINPSLTPVNSLTNFKFWCQKVLPLVYDDSLSYYEVLGKMVVQLNDVIDNVNADTENVLTLKDAFLELQTYVNNFFDDIDQLASYAERAEAAQTAANTSAVNASTSASNASASSLAAMDARDTAVTAKQAAETSANTASTAATNANTKANEAAQSAITAQTAQASASQSATLAATDRSAAQTAANTATTKANEASTSAENASQSEANAEELVNNIQENLDNIQHNTQDISDLKESFIYNDVSLELSAVSDGYIDTDGNIAGTGGGARHLSAVINSALVGKNIKVSGVAWWGMKPFVFVGSNGTIVYANVPSPNGTVTPYTNLDFAPTIDGTLYINYHTDRPVFGATINQIISIKNDKLPTDLAENIDTVQSYKKITFNTITGKYLNGSNGNITNVDSENAVITDYIEVTPSIPYLITTEHFWGNGMYVWFDSSKNYISGFSSNNSGTITQIRNKKVIAPNNAKYLVVAMWIQGNFPPITIYEGQKKSIAPNLKWAGKKWVCLGDSLTGENLTSVYHYYNAVASQTGITFYQMGIGGSGYANDGDNNYAFWRRALTVPNDADVITIFGSFNDLSSGLPLGSVDDNDTTTIAGCMNKTIENILSVIPTANIGIVAPTPWSTTRPSTSGDTFNYVEMLKAVADRWSLPFLDLWRHSGLMPWDSNFCAIAYPAGDTVHPNDIGQKIIAPKFKAFLETLLM